MFESFYPVSLEELERRAQVLTRFNNKYIVSVENFPSLLGALENNFDILEINGHRSFFYETCYFDDERASSYFNHHQGRRKRIKIRTRRYLDTDSCFLEVKFKHKRGSTVKRRMAYPSRCHGMLNEGAVSFIKEQYLALYDEEFSAALIPSISMSFSRVTLIGKQGGERLTIDSELSFFDESRTIRLPSNLLILEAKSTSIRGVAHRLFQQQHFHPVKKCSKYCIGMAMAGKVEKTNKFRNTMSKFSFRPDSSSRSPVLEPLEIPADSFVGAASEAAA